MSRLGKELKLEKDKQIESGFLMCNSCNTLKPLYYFNRQVKTNKIYYKNKKCKLCVTGKEPNVHKNVLLGEIRAPKQLKIKNDIILSLEAKEFIKRVIYMRGYVDSVECFQLVHHHINTFGYNERLIADTQTELTTMLNELLYIFNREKNKNNI